MTFELLRQQARPPREESTFIEISRVLLAGLLLTAGSVTLLAVVGGPLVDLSAWLSDGTRYAAEHLGLVGASVAAELVQALLLAVIAHDILAPTAATRIIHETGWRTAFSRTPGPGEEAFLSVQLKDGTTITGYRADYSTEPDPARRELILRPPLTIRLSRASHAAPLDKAWQRLVLHGGEIATIAVAFVAVGRPPSVQPRHVRFLSRMSAIRWRLAVTVEIILLVGLVAAKVIH